MKFARLIPEIYCSRLDRSLEFYVGLLGFSVVYQRPEEAFAFLDREGAQIMLEEPGGRTLLTAELSHPFGRGVNLQIEVGDVRTLYQAVEAAAWPLFLPLEDRWYRRDDVLAGNRQFWLQDPDGYLLRLFENLGEKPWQDTTA